MGPERMLPVDDALAPLPAGELHWLRCGELEVAFAAGAGGRVAHLRYQGVEWLVDAQQAGPAAIAWGCYPMVPWAGRIRRGQFHFDGRPHRLPLNFDGHAIHGVGFSRPWRIDRLDAAAARLSLELPSDGYWPFGGAAVLDLQLQAHSLQMDLSVQAGGQAMPAVLGWHPWFRKPERLLFSPRSMYPRDREGIATLPRVEPTTGPWDDCFIADGDVTLIREGQHLRLRSDHDHWVVYDGTPHATCVEPQSGPPDGYTLAPHRLEPGQRLALTFELAWAADST
ncbi:aldose epimerase [Stenotrophomonas maltophilia]|uniref:aldose epimerase family protein n=2 Tax=Lysobacteraceae TaxID=32033 RepID=UPI0005A47E62|nr:aldose epimerase [Stenotrophomonas sp. GD03744]MBA0339231.1 aldose epimerase [Stenotrophomonas maltophilia]QCB35847.1 aldose epimerase [Stenotrophomonas sp. PAMC25021]MBH1512225.1 aldose epimerase [Stenotrophomonas maltophilia]MBH1545015.1 aldose epimerase [Stenotrophomonas maltophilia]MBH1735992.1 aldose epimerase [Stenotrophomonas maltophilia]